VHALPRGQLDVTDDTAVEHAFARLDPTAVFNCAAFHNVGVCEVEEDRSFEVNARAVKRLAERCRTSGALLVHLSTNYVFDGKREEPYTEDDRPAPRSVYAISKLAGEHMALAYAPDVLVVRTAGLYGRHGSESKGGNFVTRMIAKARTEGAITMVEDQRLTPTYTADLAAALIDASEAGVRGLLHLTNSGSCSWLEFTEAILAGAGVATSVEGARTEIAPGQPDRPLNGVLTSARGLPALRHWSEALEDYLQAAELTAAGQRS
jgi:dTDP-4-dehydrorhamnose reductase